MHKMNVQPTQLLELAQAQNNNPLVTLFPWYSKFCGGTLFIYYSL